MGPERRCGATTRRDKRLPLPPGALTVFRVRAYGKSSGDGYHKAGSAQARALAKRKLQEPCPLRRARILARHPCSLQTRVGLAEAQQRRHLFLIEMTSSARANCSRNRAFSRCTRHNSLMSARGFGPCRRTSARLILLAPHRQLRREQPFPAEQTTNLPGGAILRRFLHEVRLVLHGESVRSSRRSPPPPSMRCGMHWSDG